MEKSLLSLLSLPLLMKKSLLFLPFYEEFSAVTPPLYENVSASPVYEEAFVIPPLRRILCCPCLVYEEVTVVPSPIYEELPYSSPPVIRK